MLNPVCTVNSDNLTDQSSDETTNNIDLSCRFATVPSEMLQICDAMQACNVPKFDFAAKADMKSLLLNTMVEEDEWGEDFFDLQTETDGEYAFRI